MARPSKAALERAREMSEKSDDEIGRWLEALVDGALSERYSNKLARIARRFEILEQSLVEPVLNAIKKASKLEKPGTGIAFVVEVDRAIGLESQIERFKKAAEKIR